ncbi:MAG: GNAT family N-acetyltransferase [Planctomycetaceae bacterium]|nr:GNAT family N-acetyltransferase [Planctomycetaceae bacterium]
MLASSMSFEPVARQLNAPQESLRHEQGVDAAAIAELRSVRADLAPITTGREIVVKSRPVVCLTSNEFACWERLFDRCRHHNHFLAPGFVRAMADTVVPDQELQVLVVENEPSNEWLAAAVFVLSELSLSEPLPVLSMTASPYTFLEGLLVDPEHGERGLDTMFSVLSQGRESHGLHFSALRKDALAHQLDAAAARQGIQRHVRALWHRAQLRLGEPLSVEVLLERCSKSRRKSLRRARKRLEALGRVEFRLTRPRTGRDATVDTFLDLEGLGWKGAARTSLIAQFTHERFFRLAVHEAALRQAVVFGEMLLNGDVVASTCNLLAGDRLFAFKIGWAPHLAECSLGLWSELELAAAISCQLPQVKLLDSCATPGSYVETVWSDRAPMISVSYTWSKRAQLVHTTRTHWKKLRQFFT